MVQASTSLGLGWSNDTAWQTGMSSLTAQTDAALNSATAGESIVVGYHFWVFEKPDGSVDPARIALFKQYVDHLKSRGDVSFSTLGGQPLMNPSLAPAVSTQNGSRLGVFAQGTQRTLWNNQYQLGSGWSAWEYLGGYLTSSPLRRHRVMAPSTSLHAAPAAPSMRRLPRITGRPERTSIAVRGRDHVSALGVR